MYQGNVLKSIADVICTAYGEHGTRSKHNDLVGMLNVIGLAPRNMHSKRYERLTSYKSQQIIRSHHKVRCIFKTAPAVRLIGGKQSVLPVLQRPFTKSLGIHRS